jgi:hypothetical protein
MNEELMQNQLLFHVTYARTLQFLKFERFRFLVFMNCLDKIEIKKPAAAYRSD